MGDDLESVLNIVREYRDAIEKLARQDRNDNLDSAARIALDLADSNQPSRKDFKAWGIGPEDQKDELESITSAPDLGTRSFEVTQADLREPVEAVLNEIGKEENSD